MNLLKSSIVVVLTLLVCSWAFLPTVFAMESNFAPLSDTHIINSNLPSGGIEQEDTNSGSQIYFVAGDLIPTAGLRQISISLIQFDLSSIPTASTITSANLLLHIYAYNGVQNPGNVYVGSVSSPWSEATVTYNTRPSLDNNAANAFDSEYCQLFTYGEDTHWVSFDLTTEVQAVVNGQDNNGWCIFTNLDDSMNTQVSFDSKENGVSSYCPVLNVVYTPSTTVVPEYAFGGLIAFAACLVAFVVYKKLPAAAVRSRT